MNRLVTPVYRLLARYSAWWSDRVSDDWYDLRTRAGLVNGLFSMFVNVLQFSLLLLLVLLLDIAGMGGAKPPTISLLVLPVAFLYGLGMLLAYQTSARINQRVRNFPGNFRVGIPLQVLTYGTYMALLLVHVGLAVIAGGLYIVGKICALTVLFVPAELKRSLG